MDGRAAMTTGKHILIVDDYPDALDIWAIYLRAMGFRVSTAGDGAEAIAQAERLRANPETQHIPLIAATGYSHVKQLDRAREAGFDQIVIKPCDPDLLVEEIERHLLAADELDTHPGHFVMEHGHENG